MSDPASPSIPAPVPRPSRLEWLGLAAVLALALVLRLIEARGAALWFDEIYVVMVARQSVAGVIDTLAHDIHPPLYFLLVHLWRGLGGEGALWLKAPSLAGGLASIALTFALARRLGGPRAGVVAAAMLALDTAHIHYSQELEVYPLLWVFAVGVAYFAVCWVERRRGRDAAGFVLCAALGAWTHYLVPIVVAITALWGLAVLRRERGAVLRWLGLVALVGVAFTPQLGTFHGQWVREGSGAYFHWPAPDGLTSLARAAALGALYLVPVFAALALAALGTPGRGRYAALALALAVLIPPCTRAWPFVITRDMLVVLPFGMALAGAGIARLRWKGSGSALAVVLLLFGARTWSHHQPFAEPRALAEAERVVAREMPPGTTLVHSETHSLLFFRYYRPADRNLLLYPAGRRVPFFDAGLVIPPEWLVSPEEWAHMRERGEPWWGVHCDRAYVTRGVVSRAGQLPERLMDSLATGRRWAFPPVRLWEGVAGPGGRRPVPAGAPGE